MKLKNKILWGFLFIFVFTSCSKNIYFTQDMRRNLNKNKLGVDQVQFYNSKKIMLQRNLTFAETKIARGELSYKNGQYLEEIIIPKNTPGVAVSENNNVLNVAFEDGKNRSLKFVLNEKDRYQISASSWQNNYGKVIYDTLVYYIEPRSDKAMLLVRKNNIYDFRLNKRVVKGKRINR